MCGRPTRLQLLSPSGPGSSRGWWLLHPQYVPCREVLLDSSGLENQRKPLPPAENKAKLGDHGPGKAPGW